MTNSYKIILATLILAGIFVLVVFLNNRQTKQDLIKENPNNGWQVYINEALGFEIKYPKKIVSFADECNFNDDLVPVKVFEDDNSIYISHKYFYKKVGSECKIINNSIDFLNEEVSWNIIIDNDVYNDDDLVGFIKRYYGDKCTLWDKELSAQEGVYDVFARGDGKDFDNSECFLNSWSPIKYYPSKGHIAIWQIGQESVFWGDSKGVITFDQEMVDSFRFLE